MCSRLAQVNGKFVPQCLWFTRTVPRGKSPAENPARFWVDIVVGWGYSFCRLMAGRKGSAMTGRRVPRFSAFFWECAFSPFGIRPAKTHLSAKRGQRRRRGCLFVLSPPPTVDSPQSIFITDTSYHRGKKLPWFQRSRRPSRFDSTCFSLLLGEEDKRCIQRQRTRVSKQLHLKKGE
jgi:hypothetical protein